MHTRCRVFIGLAAVVMAAILATPAPATAQNASEECLGCHSDPIDITLKDGTTRTLQMHGADLAQSVHSGLACVDCHPEARDLPHAERTFASRRQFTVANSEQCRQCHFTEYRESLESVHAQAVAREYRDFIWELLLNGIGGAKS